MTPKQMYIAFMTILTKDVKRTFRLWIQTILPAVVTTVLYFLIFGTFIGSQVQSMGGVSYMTFIVPGLVLMAVLNSSFQGMLFSFYFMKFQKTVEEILVSPMPHSLVVAGYISGAVTRGGFIGLVVFASAFFFERIPIAHPFLALLVIIITAVLFALMGLVNAVYARNFDDLSIVSTFALTPLTYLGGVFYSITLLPPIWQTVSHFNPILYLINAFRYSLLGFSDIPFTTGITVLLGCCVVMFSWVLYLFKTGRGLKA
jgi:ABC-2 type transport system permease protein